MALRPLQVWLREVWVPEQSLPQAEGSSPTQAQGSRAQTSSSFCCRKLLRLQSGLIDLWLPSGFYSVSQVLSHASQGWSRTEAASFFCRWRFPEAGGCCTAMHWPCHLPDRVVTELITCDCPRTHGEQGVFVPVAHCSCSWVE